MGVLEFGRHTVRGSSQSACLKPKKHHPITNAVGVHRWGGGWGLVVTLQVRGYIVQLFTLMLIHIEIATTISTFFIQNQNSNNNNNNNDDNNNINGSIYMAHISSLTSYCPWSLDMFIHFYTPGSICLQNCDHVALVTCCTMLIAISVQPGTHLHLSEVKHLRIKCLAQGYNTGTTMSQS